MDALRYRYLGLTVLLALLGLGGIYFFELEPKNVPPHPGVGLPPKQILAPTPTFVVPSPASASQPPSADKPGTAIYHYNSQGQVQAIVYPDGAVYSYQYNSYGDKIRETTTTGQTWSYVYDANHRLVSVIDPQGRISHPETSATAPKTP